MTDHLKWTSHLFRAFYKEGVSHVYISPGSRSTPLALAAAVHPGFTSHVVVDERSAAFQALGSGKASGVPAILICTSGTALANYHPAVIEAKQSGAPLIVISADRPPHLRGTGSSQTIDQIKLFSDSAVMFHELGEPVFDKRDLSRLELLAQQAVLTAIQKGGAVHLNAPFRKPLEPASESLQREENLNRQQIEDIRNRSVPDGPSPAHPASNNPASDSPKTSPSSNIPEPNCPASDSPSSSYSSSNQPSPDTPAPNSPSHNQSSSDKPAPNSPSPKHRAAISQPLDNPHSNQPIKKPVLTLPEWIVDQLNDAERPLLIAGPDESWRSLKTVTGQLAGRLNLPVIAEPGSHLSESIKMMDRYDILLNDKELQDSLKPDFIIRAGDQPFSKSLQVFEANHRGTPVLQLLSRDTWQDSFGSVDYRIILQDNELDLSNLNKKNSNWRKQWEKENSRAGSYLDQTLASFENLTDGHIYNYFTKKSLNDWEIMSSNSFTIRDLSLFGEGPHRMHRSYGNRGAAGIDGILSTAIGINQAGDRKTAVFIGDLAILHDSNALLSLKHTRQPLAVIIINNSGGNIFRMLPVFNEKQYYTRFFETPQQVDYSGLAHAHNLPYHLIDSVKQLHAFDLNKSTEDGPALIECKTDPGSSMKLRRMLWNRE